jgi:hypothetical protein
MHRVIQADTSFTGKYDPGTQCTVYWSYLAAALRAFHPILGTLRRDRFERERRIGRKPERLSCNGTATNVFAKNEYAKSSRRKARTHCFGFCTACAVGVTPSRYVVIYKLGAHVEKAHRYPSAGSPSNEDLHGPTIPIEALPESWPPAGNTLHWDAFFDHAMTPPTSSHQMQNDGFQPLDLETWTSEFFEDPIFDWIGWDSHV